MAPNDTEQLGLLRDIERAFIDGKVRGSPILDALPDLVFLLHEDGTILDYHAPDERDLLLPPEEFVGRNVRETMPPAVVEQLLAAFTKAKTSGELQLLEYPLENKGVQQWFECRIVTAGDDHFLAIVRNTARQHAAELALQESELFNRRIIESSNDCIKILDLDGNLLYLNPQGERILEIGPDDHCIGTQWLEFWGAIDRATLDVELDKARAGVPGRFQGETPTFRGTPKWWDVMITPISGAGGKVERLLVVSRDITEQKTAEEKLLSTESFFRSLIENTHDMVSVLDLNGAIIYESPSCKRLLGYEPGERVGISCFDFIHPDDQLRVIKIFRDAIEHRKATELVEYRYRHDDGSWLWVEVIARYSTDEAGRPIMIVNRRDISERHKSQEELRASEERLYSFIDNCPAATWITDEDGVLLHVNAVCYQALKLLEPDMIGKSMFEVFPESFARMYTSSIKRAAVTGSDVQRLDEQIRGDGTLGSYIAYRFPITDSHPRLVGGFAIDVTEQRRAERQLAASEEKYRSIVDTMLEGIWILDAETRITFVNSQLAEMLGYQIEELVGRPSFDFMVDPPSAEARRKRRTASGSKHFVATLAKKDRSLITALVSARPIFDETGKLQGSLAVLMDVTERMRTHEQLEQLTACLLNLQDEERRRIARELHDGTAQNLAAIVINLSTLRELAAENDKAAKVLDDVQDLASSSLREIRTLSYLLHPPLLEETGLAAALQWFIGGYSERSGIKVDLDIDGRVGRLSPDIETALYRIIQEALNNVYRHSASPVAHISIKRENKGLVLTICDEGRGMSKESQINLGVGIRGMKERLRFLEGSLEIGSAGGGTTLTCVVPIGSNK